MERQKEKKGENKEHFIIGIGASAGGLEALERFFQMIPEESGASYIVIQHLSPDFKSMMNELLARHTVLPIHMAVEGLEVEPNNIYLIPAGKELTISEGRLSLVDKIPSQGLSLPVNIFFESLAKNSGDKAIGIILSGTGTDGSEGIKAIKDAGGMVICQDPESAKFDGMPRAAIETNVVDLILEPEQMGPSLIIFIADPIKFNPSAHGKSLMPECPSTEEALLQLLKKEYGTDFSYYKSTTINRRIERRMVMGDFSSLTEYVDHLAKDSEELNKLYQDFLIGVTKFIRDREAFDLIASDVIPDLVRNYSKKSEIRVWSAGCASGEEAYSLAILFYEEARKQNRNIEVKIFATDLHTESLDFASRGIYQSEVLSEIPDEWLERYFVETEHGFKVSPELRKSLVFTKHDIIKDPPFTKIDLISCRNLLIYLVPEIQHRIISTFHFALSSNGTMFLGPSETLGELSEAFEANDHHWKIFTKLNSVRLKPMERLPIEIGPLSSSRDRTDSPLMKSGKIDERLLRAYDAILDRYVPGAFLINEQRELVHCFGNATEYLKPRKGRYSLDLLEMLGDELRITIETALQRSLKQNKSVHFKGVSITSGLSDQTDLFDIWIETLENKGSVFKLVVLERVKNISKPVELPSTKESNFSIEQISRERVTGLETELRYTKENLQATIEELETSNEEMQSTNEELVASNEELQSTNEELHSVNEELYTVNSEYQKKIDELTQLTNDMNNLLSSTDIGTIFLDKKLRIRKFTPAVEAAFDLLQSDVGRQIETFSSSFDIPDLLPPIKKVIRTGVGFEEEILNGSNQSYLLRVRPYLVNKRVEGVVMSFIDIDSIKKAQLGITQKQAELEQFTATVAHDLKAPLRKISQFSKFARDSQDNGDKAKVLKFLDSIERNTEQMTRLIQDLLSYSRMDLGEMSCDEVDVAKVVKKVKSGLEGLITETGAKIKTKNLSSVSSDMVGLNHLFSNLISNGIKYRKEGVAPIITIIGSEDENSFIFKVKDNGIGIEANDQEQVFKPFLRLDGSDTCEGSGLGLSICQKIIKRLGGEIWLESEVGKGSTFHFTIPKPQSHLTPDLAVPQTKRVRKKGDPIKIAHLDDDRSESEILENYLKKSKIKKVSYTYCENPAELERLCESGEVDALFIDYDLKRGENGVEVLKSLRKSGFEGPAFLFSGIANSAIEGEFADAGGNLVLNKAELNAEALATTLDKHLR